MENLQNFAELHSADPVERNLAQQVLGILRNASLTRSQQQTQIADLQARLLQHRRKLLQAQRQANLAQHLQKMLQSLPDKRPPACVQITAGRLMGGVSIKLPTGGSSFYWQDMGQLPDATSLAEVKQAIASIRKSIKPAQSVSQRDPLATRRRELRKT